MQSSCLRSSFSQLLLLGAAVAFSATAHAQSTMSPEELAVRTAYARLAFATETNALLHAVFGGKQAASPDAVFAKEQLHVVLSSFKVGAVSDLGGHGTFADLADSPLRPLIVSASTTDWTEPSSVVSQLVANAAWASTPDHNAGILLPLTTYGTYGDSSAKRFGRYASYVATVTLDGETRTARATVFFDEQGRVAIVDEMVGAALIPFFTESVYPHVLLETMTRQFPAVEAWLPHHVVSASSCKADQRHDCFDQTSGAVGILQDDLQRSLLTPPPRKPAPATPAVSAGVSVYQPSLRHDEPQLRRLDGRRRIKPRPADV